MPEPIQEVVLKYNRSKDKFDVLIYNLLTNTKKVVIRKDKYEAAKEAGAKLADQLDCDFVLQPANDVLRMYAEIRKTAKVVA